MHRRSIRLVLIASLALSAFAAPAAAASSSQIHQDAADGSIDGTYTLAEMRAADRTVSAEQREYYGWEDVYAAWLRAQSDPGGVVPVVPVDADRDGVIEPAEREAARKKTRAKCTKATAKAKRSKVCRAAGDVDGADTPEAEPRSEDNAPAADAADDGSGEDGSPLLWLIVGVPLLIVATGAWRMYRGRPKGDPSA